MSKDVRIRGYFSKTEGAREQRSFGNTALYVILLWTKATLLYFYLSYFTYKKKYQPICWRKLRETGHCESLE